MIRWGTDFFAKKNIDSPRLTIELMLCEVINVSRMQLYMIHDKPLSKDELVRMREMVSRRVKREPLQYILGKTNFFGLEIFVDPSVLIPRPETEILVEHAKKSLSDRKKNFPEKKFSVLDIGTGSGCIALALAKNFPEEKFLAVDVSEQALDIAKKNSSHNGIENISFTSKNILEEIPEEKFDLIVSNPPYISPSELEESEPEVKDFEPKIALTDNSDGLKFYRRFAEIFPQILSEGGEFFLEMGFGQMEKMEEIFSHEKFEISFIHDYEKIPRIVQGRLK